MSLLSRWIGDEGRAAERLSLTFHALGLTQMTTERCTEYVMNICDRVRADLTRDECLAVVRYALTHPVTKYHPGDLDFNFILGAGYGEEMVNVG